MRKVAVVVTALVVALAVAAVAIAAQVNTYTVTASTSPTKAGSKKKPVPVSTIFDYTVGEASGQRPAVVKTYQIKFKGIRTNGKYFKTCTAAQITAASGSNSGCPAKSEVGTGLVNNVVGNSADPSSQALQCSLNLILYNGGQDVLTLYLTPNGATNPCPAQAQAFSGTFRTKGLFTTLSFNVPPTLLHPVAGLDTAVTRTQSTIRKLTVKAKVHGKKRKVGYFESFGGCVKGKRPTTVIFTQEDGTVGKASTTSKCKKK